MTKKEKRAVLAAVEEGRAIVSAKYFRRRGVP